MLLLFFRGDISKRRQPKLARLVCAAGVVLFVSLQCWAAEPVLPALLQSEWVAGPATVPLGTFAELNVPQGYKFADPQAARGLLADGVPDGLAGVLTPDSGAWRVVFSYTESGYIKDPEKENLDATALLNALLAQNQARGHEVTGQGEPSPSSIDWELKPLYDPADHSLEWAVREQGKSGAVVIHRVTLLGRRAVLNAVVTRAYRGFSDLAPVKLLVRGVSFRSGERYADYQATDKLAASGLTALVALDQPKQGTGAPDAVAGGLGLPKGRLPWIWLGGSAAGLCLVLLTVSLVRRKPRGESDGRRAWKAMPEAVPHSGSGPAAAPVTKALPSAVDFKSKRETAPAGLKAKAAARGKRINGHHLGERKREFDYNRYFTDLLSAVSSHSSYMEGPAVNGYAPEEAPPPATPDGPAPAAKDMSATSDLIASQKALIEDQKRLILEQSKLIEEKTRLIAEKNQLLKMQSELIEQKLL